MTKTTFKDLPIGATFRFACETDICWQGARGPWIKLTPQKYMHEVDGDEFHIGSVRAPVVAVGGKSTASKDPRNAVLGLTLAACLLLPGLADAAPVKAKRVTIPPVYSITVKVVTPAQYDRKVASKPGAEDPGAWLISSSTPTTCTAWVRLGAGLEAELDAYNGCRWLLRKSGR